PLPLDTLPPLLNFFFLLLILPPSTSTLFPYTTLFRSQRDSSKTASSLFSATRLSMPAVTCRRPPMRKSLISATPRFHPVLWTGIDRKSTRLNSSHVAISYAVFCLKKKKKITNLV